MKDFIIKQLNRLSLFIRNPDEIFTGAILPTESDLADTPRLEELVARINPVDWKPLDIKKVPKYPIYSQNGSGSCVAMSMALIASILYFKRRGITTMFSAAWIYQRRTNQGSGMIGTDSFKIASKGLLLETLMPSQDLTEEQIDSVIAYPEYNDVAKVFALDDTFIQLPTKDIETVASTMQTTNKPVMVWFEFLYEEWTSIPFIKSTVSAFTKLLRHSTVAIDYGIYEGEKSIVIQESWGFGSTNFGVARIIKESFFNKRNIFSAYPIRFKFDLTGSKEVYNGTIISFQKCMRSIGLFPSNIDFVERFGPVTRQACVQFQSSQGLAISGTLDAETQSRLRLLFK